MDRPQNGFAAALAILTRRDHSELELIRKLERKGFAPAEIAETVARLRDCGYLDDRRLAGRLVETALASGRLAGFRLRQELRRRGIPPELAAEALARETAGYDERAAIGELLARKFPRLTAAADPREKRRAVGWFLRRGFSLANVLAALQVAEHEIDP
ncbi:regulatory protein RecX [Geotalea uraniireducens]|uniref:Regulatory protein RecX n=1 Tax=Geotalea uraniireducens TaxID=351604 RepID=A0ABM8ERA7_9BACT|nr:regulatory protein RecX [Geotalea uraniireducens]BDV44695.1 regulatory protein RecX [Geotalea uraniireducens]